MPDPACMDITDEKFQELTDITVKLIEDCDLGKKGMCATMMVHYREFNKQFMPSDIHSAVIVLAGGMADEEQKYATIKELGRQCFYKKWFPVAVFLAAESWSSDRPDLYERASQDPNKTECIFISGRTPAGDCKIGIHIPLGRDEDGNMIRAGDNRIIKELEMYLLNKFFHGFFEKVTGKGTDEDVRSETQGGDGGNQSHHQEV